MSLERVGVFRVDGALVEETDRALRAAGTDGFEAFVLWTGVIEDDTFEVGEINVPRQTSYRQQAGLCVRVEGDELHRLNVWLYENKRVLGVQVHSHPMEAYHSDTDDGFPIVTTRGGLSVVVPYFGKRGVRGPGTAIYRLEDGGWRELQPKDGRSLLVVAD